MHEDVKFTLTEEGIPHTWLNIPGPVGNIYRQLDTPAHIYYKYEGVSPTGSLKPNSAVPQADYNQQVGRTGLITETGAGQTHAVRAAVDEALRCRAEGRTQTILIGLPGHGKFDLAGYEMYQNGLPPDDSASDEELERWFWQ